jgi:hypothetical protein
LPDFCKLKIAYATAWPCVIEMSEPLLRWPISPSFLGL